MRTFKFKPTHLLLVMLLIISMTSCDENTFYPLIESIPCETPETADPSIINDFECQDNMLLPDVEAVLNPDEAGANTSRFVGKYIDPSGAWDALIVDFGAAINLSTKNTFKIKVLTSVAGTLKAKLEGGTSGGIEVDATISNTSNWVEYSFDFSSQFNQNHTKLVLFFNAGVDTGGSDVYYIDDLRWDTSTDPCVGVAEDINVINDFDCQKNQDIPEVELTATPNKNAINSSKFSGKYIDETGAWDAVIVDFGAPINLTTHNAFKIKVLAPVTGTLKAKLEGGTSNGIEKDVQITTTGQWVEYTFDFSSEANANHQKLVLFFNAGVDTDGTQVYFIDDLKFAEVSDPCNGVIEDLSIVNDFNCQQNSTIPGYVTNSIVENPDQSGINTSDAVLKVTDNGTDAWDALVIDLGRVMDLSTKNYLRIKILSTRAVPLLAKLEGGTSGAKEVWGAITTTGVWTEYVFDFSDQATANHKKIVLFFNGGQNDGTASDVYYIDDIRFAEYDPCAGVIPDLSIVNNFECQQNYAVVCCITTEIVTNPYKTGINTSDSVLKVTDNGTDAWDALVFDLGAAINLSTKNQLKIKIYSTKSVPLLAKLEGGTSGAKEVWGTITTANAWTEYTFDFSDQAAANHKKIVLFFNGGASDGTASDIYFIDDLKWE
ncbi:MAG: carbohydrate binding domain-containing protein [Lutibacter sp.]